ncbi:RsmB/NOP family class I SAM-dependent RNA methyltransferase [Pacificimonas sp. WHA3]|uniref:RsmB/NOP family class I SAM-dependent RNA methyltransferase n=1 Tax=Pacificimonas pallii TaxID=2827236 RepID=A0ABS6SE64_9SPHN|nr:RsmB/NOP family class I SAM-dependent RNA methyltransferase [Pacificimonas pallii]MBV7256708.1 RsmB/NOP family class I SAM-dependent RNA methyltransferase [Pacificimonas pallii]
MTPGARVAAAIEILDDVITSAREGGAAADVLIARYFKTRRYAGSKDRRAVREIVYDCIRGLDEIPANGRAAIMGAQPSDTLLFTGDGHAPAPVDPSETPATRGLAPQWLRARLGERADADLLMRAGIDLRVNALKAEPDQLLHLGSRIDGFPHALAGAPADISRRPEYLSGLVEVQDRGSQRIAAICAASAGMTVVDLCAGGGGKALALAADMRNDGVLLASDTDWRRLGELPARAERAGASIIAPIRLDPGAEIEALAQWRGRADIVLVDAPCSGTGTWRRNPEAKWRLTADRLSQLTILQARLMHVAAALVKPGGALIYAVCSLLPEEGSAQADGFDSSGFSEVSRKLLTPKTDGSDGFFIARFEKAC